MLALSLGSWRWFGWLAILVVGLILVACASDDPQQAEPEPQSVAQTEQEQAQEEPQVEQQAQTVDQPQPEAEQQQAEAAPAQAQQAAEQRAEAQTSEQAGHEQQAVVQQAESSPATDRTLEGVRGIVDPSNSGWPRQVEGLNGIVTIPAKPLRIITASIGHDEMTLALVPNERLVAVGSVTKNVTYSNVATLVQDKPEISRDPEVIIAQSPDVVVTSPFFPVEAIDALERVGIVVVQTELIQSPQARIDSILLMGYIFGEEDRAFEFADEVQARYEALVAITSSKSPQPSVLALTQYSDTLWVAGGNSTEGGVILAAGGVNAAEIAGIQGNQTTSLEGVIAMAPSVIIIPQPMEFGADEFRQSLLDNEALAEVPAIRSGAVHVVESKHFTTLSFWNIRGAEDLARLLWPEDFPDPPAQSFSVAE